MYMWIHGGRGADIVSVDDESFGDFSEVRNHVRDVTMGDVVFYGGVKDFAVSVRGGG